MGKARKSQGYGRGGTVRIEPREEKDRRVLRMTEVRDEKGKLY